MNICGYDYEYVCGKGWQYIGPSMDMHHTKEKEMQTEVNNFASERRAFEHAINDACVNARSAARKRFHMDSYRPSTLREWFALFDARKITVDGKPFHEADLDKEIPYYDRGSDHMSFRVLPPDEKGFNEAIERLHKEETVIRLAARTLPPSEASPRVESFVRTYH